MNDKRCWTMIHCELHSKCQLPLNPERNGDYRPTSVGEFCHAFKPRVIESDPWHGLANKAGAHE